MWHYERASKMDLQDKARNKPKPFKRLKKLRNKVVSNLSTRLAFTTFKLITIHLIQVRLASLAYWASSNYVASILAEVHSASHQISIAAYSLKLSYVFQRCRSTRLAFSSDLSRSPAFSSTSTRMLKLPNSERYLKVATKKWLALMCRRMSKFAQFASGTLKRDHSFRSWRLERHSRWVIRATQTLCKCPTRNNNSHSVQQNVTMVLQSWSRWKLGSAS